MSDSWLSEHHIAEISDRSSVTTPLGDFKDSAYSGDDYTYDANGNTPRDYNLHMVSAAGGGGAAFNYLDKPDSMVVNGKAGTHDVYDAAGIQLAKQVNDYTMGTLVA